MGSVSAAKASDPIRVNQGEAEVKSNIRNMIGSGGLWYHMLGNMYMKLIGVPLPQQYLDAVCDWTDVCTIDKMYVDVGVELSSPTLWMRETLSMAIPCTAPSDISIPYAVSET